jgi:hypothetical protein
VLAGFTDGEINTKVLAALALGTVRRDELLTPKFASPE